ncbi:MAG: class I SAM-dependent methyltransferase family protein [Theionarchaea archaeon]|nr:class I SAM-dependent methyltransferase family protein [Theionarchaea archaeon]MBU7036758.1 class I SAM-dependent methyltransferase family protein [Theionarchaea archaeon]
MRGLKVPKREGESIRKSLVEENILVKGYKIERDEGFLYFPVKREVPGYDMVEMDFQESPSAPESLGRFGLKSFDIIGDIAVVDIPEELEDKKMEIASILLSRSSVHTVVGKTSRISGPLRTRTFEHLLGEEKTVTIHKEYGILFKVDIEHVYFNPRLSTERRRIAQKVSPGEVVIDMFCGVGPFSIMIAKHSQPKIIYAIDINARAIELLKDNIVLNKANRIIPILGDAGEEITHLECADRVIMNLPQNAFEFLPKALSHGRIIHYYCITSDIEKECQRIHSLSQNLGQNVHIMNLTTVKSYAPDMDMYRIDLSTA